MRKLFRLLMALSACMLMSCSTEDDIHLVFIGDSIIARWDLEESFPTYIVENKGVSGSGIETVANYAHKCNGKDIVVMVGTNDLYDFDDLTIIDYAKIYLEQIVETNATTIYLYSILPRNFEGDSPSINQRIERLNSMIQRESEKYGNVVYIDAYSFFIADGDINPQYSYDGLHLSPYGYEVLSKLLNSNLR